MYRLFFLIFICPNLFCQDLGKILWEDEVLTSPLNFDFISSKFKNNSNNKVSGNFSINSYPNGLGYEVLRDESIFIEGDVNKLFKRFPEFNLSLLIKNNRVLIEDKKIIETNHEFWDISFSDGSAWNEDENIFLAIPFALIQKHANCTHNGVLIFSINKSYEASKSIVQISSETCPYFQFNYVAIFDSSFEKNEVFITEKNNIIKEKRFNEIYKKYPQISKKSFADSDIFNEYEVTAFGFYDGEDHFIDECKTRSGNYPFCTNIILPAYSLTKTIAGTLGVAAFEYKYGAIGDININKIIKSCNDKKWKNVTIENLADMTTGNYKSSIHSLDEDNISSLNFIFNLITLDEKEEFACNQYPNKSKPNTKFVYHSSDTFLLGLALNNLLKERDENDFFNDLLIPIFDKKDFSEKIKYIRRTNDSLRQPYSGWGMFFERNDLIKLNNLIRSKDRVNFFSDKYISEALQLTDDKGFIAIKSSNIYYNNGLWSAKFSKEIFNCEEDIYVPFMSGFGGITVVFLPNSMMYYYISDNYTFSWYSAVYAAHEIKPIC